MDWLRSVKSFCGIIFLKYCGRVKKLIIASFSRFLGIGCDTQGLLITNVITLVALLNFALKIIFAEIKNSSSSYMQ